MIYLALYIADLLVSVNTSLVKWINAKSLECQDIVNNDTEIMSGGDYRQADGCLQNTTNIIRSDSSYGAPQVSGFQNHLSLKRSIDLGSTKLNQISCQRTASTNVSQKSKH